ncbi:hypothetical protein Asal01_01730 [Fodinibius salicampi]
MLLIRMKYRFLGIFLCLSGLLSVHNTAKAQLQSPSQFLGYELGSQWTPHHKVMDYVDHLAEESPMAQAETYGESYEGRNLKLMYVSSEENMDRLEEIRQNNLRRVGLINGKADDDETAIIWLSYNVHGNEPSSSEAALETLYELLRADNPETKEWLDNTVVIIDPMLNPDGRTRYTNWYRQSAGEEPNARLDAREHHEPWPGGRTNHYYFDLNRDWAWLTQKESWLRLQKYQQWMPHIHVDFHEQGYDAPYYFAPAAEPFHEAITDWQQDFQYTIGKNNASYFDENDWLYFTGEIFDLFYPSYGDTYPIFNGAIGMTYEQGGHSRAGLAIKKVEGDTLTLHDRLIHHKVSGLATIETASENAGKLVEQFSSYYNNSRNEPEGEYKTYVIKRDNSTDKIQSLLTLLDHHKITYGKASDSRSVQGYNYQTGETERVEVTEEDYLVSAYQPKSVLARIFFEPRPQLVDSVTYDITAWEQHYAFGLDGYALKERLDVEPAPKPQKEINNTEAGAPYAYLASWKDLSDVRLLSALLKENIQIRYSEKYFEVDGASYDRGTLIITRRDNKDYTGDFDRTIQQIANEHKEQLKAVPTGLVEKGPDFGSSSVRYLDEPRVALLVGRGTSSNGVGEVWHFFDQQINYPLTMLRTNYFLDVDLNNYDVLILPPGSYSDQINEKRWEVIREWIHSGGRLIALQSANAMLAGKDGFELKRISPPSNDSSSISVVESFGMQQRENISDFNAGSIYKITMDPTHPLAFGYDDPYFSLKLDADAYAFLEKGWNIGIAEENAHMSGFIGYRAKEDLENTLTFGVQPMGSGSVVYMIDNPLFRAFWHNGKLLFGNALFMLDGK